MFSILGSLFWLAFVIIFGVFLLILWILSGITRPFRRNVGHNGPLRRWQGGVLILAGRFSVEGYGNIPVYEDNGGRKYIKASDYRSSVKEIARRVSSSTAYNLTVEENGRLIQDTFYLFKA